MRKVVSDGHANKIPSSKLAHFKILSKILQHCLRKQHLDICQRGPQKPSNLQRFFFKNFGTQGLNNSKMSIKYEKNNKKLRWLYM